jgi:hypothetical protein
MRRRAIEPHLPFRASVGFGCEDLLGLLCHLAFTPEIKMPFYNYLMQYKHVLAIRQMYTRRRQTKTPSNRHRRRAEFVHLPIRLRTPPPPEYGYQKAADPVGATVDHDCNGDTAQIGNHWENSFKRLRGLVLLY